MLPQNQLATTPGSLLDVRFCAALFRAYNLTGEVPKILDEAILTRLAAHQIRLRSYNEMVPESLRGCSSDFNDDQQREFYEHLYKTLKGPLTYIDARQMMRVLQLDGPQCFISYFNFVDAPDRPTRYQSAIILPTGRDNVVDEWKYLGDNLGSLPEIILTADLQQALLEQEVIIFTYGLRQKYVVSPTYDDFTDTPDPPQIPRSVKENSILLDEAKRQFNGMEGGEWLRVSPDARRVKYAALVLDGVAAAVGRDAAAGSADWASHLAAPFLLHEARQRSTTYPRQLLPSAVIASYIAFANTMVP